MINKLKSYGRNLTEKAENDRFWLERVALTAGWTMDTAKKVSEYRRSENPIDPNIIGIQIVKDMFSPTEITFYVVTGIMAIKKIRKMSRTFLKKDK